jgi:4a-hydroxytetrahydrobiopterin dehydratase
VLPQVEEEKMAKLPKPLTEGELKEALAALSDWTGSEHGLKRLLVFEDFRGAMRFMQACVDGIERQNHHPVWTNKYNSIEIHLDTFDIGHKTTHLDVELAKFIDSILAEMGHEFGYVKD